MVEGSLHEDARLVGESLRDADERSQRDDGEGLDFLG